MEIRKSKKSDVLQIVEIINQAKAYLKENGIPQWQNGYPDACDVLISKRVVRIVRVKMER